MEEGGKVLTTQTEARQSKCISDLDNNLRVYKGRLVLIQELNHPFSLPKRASIPSRTNSITLGTPQRTTQYIVKTTSHSLVSSDCSSLGLHPLETYYTHSPGIIPEETDSPKETSLLPKYIADYIPGTM